MTRRSNSASRWKRCARRLRLRNRAFISNSIPGSPIARASNMPIPCPTPMRPRCGISSAARFVRGYRRRYGIRMSTRRASHRPGTSLWEIYCAKQDGGGDRTVPVTSGAAPRARGGGSIRQQFRLSGFSHEAAYRDAMAQKVTHYAGRFVRVCRKQCVMQGATE